MYTFTPAARLCGYAHGHWFHTIRGKNGWPAIVSPLEVTPAVTQSGIDRVVNAPVLRARCTPERARTRKT
jgi:hypothetical protein